MSYPFGIHAFWNLKTSDCSKFMIDAILAFINMAEPMIDKYFSHLRPMLESPTKHPCFPFVLNHLHNKPNLCTLFLVEP